MPGAESQWSPLKPRSPRCASLRRTGSSSRTARATPRQSATRELASSGLPTFGICLGHQLVGLAFGGATAKMPYGHRGGNHPVRDIATGQVLITTQNHGFAVVGDENGVPGAPGLRVTHVNLNDHTIEGIRHRELPLFAVQYHPEASPGPHDAHPHFTEFLALLGAAGSAQAPKPLTDNR